MSIAGLLNSAWMAGSAPQAWAFAAACRRVRLTQERLLLSILHRNRATHFGRAHRFDAIVSPQTYQQRVSLSRYPAYAASMAKIAAGECNVLTRDRVQLLEPTSGSTGGEKLIPFTAGLGRQFQRAVAAWLYDLLRSRPMLRSGRSYWSISPAAGPPRRTTGGIPIGFAQDAQYLSSAQQWIVKRLLAVPAEVAQLPEIDCFRYCTLWQLLQTADLTLISIWSPTFLTALLAPLPAWQDQLCHDIAAGRPQPPTPLPAGWTMTGRKPCRGNPRRAQQLRRILQAPASLAQKLQQIWPRLALISSWADAGAARYLPELRALFPAVEFQAKGLLATEGCVSFPLLGRAAPALALRSHFFEFQELDDPQRLRLAHELDRGGRYRVVLTTAGGLYRYELRDEVEIRGFEKQCPLLSFLGKSDGVSDLVGEKLAEGHVHAVVNQALAAHGWTAGFALLAPVDRRPPFYCLYLQGPPLTRSGPPLQALAAAVDAGLCGNPHYDYARKLGQLAPAAIHLLDPLGPSAWLLYERQLLSRGLRVGNIKPLLLDRWTGWPGLFGVPAAPAATSPQAP